MMLPNVHIIGAQKAATTSLFYWLSQHNDIYAPLAAKDYPLFTDDRIWERGLDDYSSLFANKKDERIILAGSVHTFAWDHARKRLYDSFPESRLIVVLRDPVDRLLSAFNYRTKAGAESLNYLQALNEEASRAKSISFEDRTGGAYVKNGLYCQHLTGLLKLFNPEQLKIVWLEDLIDNPGKVVDDIFVFLGVDSGCHLNFDKKNETGRVKHQWLFDLCFKENRLRKWVVTKVINKAVPLEQRTRLRHWLKEINTAPSPISYPSGFDREKLVSFFINDIECLEKLTGRDLTLWKK